MKEFHSILSGPVPLIAILRGVPPVDVVGVAGAVLRAGIQIVEVPLNSPDPFRAIERLVEAHGKVAVVGAGTVLTSRDVDLVADLGGKIIVSPNTDKQVIKRTKQRGLISVAGCFTPSEAFDAINAGVDCLKLFPGEGFAPELIRALNAVLPREIPKVLVGGVRAETMMTYREVGIDGFGIGTAIYTPNKSLGEVYKDAAHFASAIQSPESTQ